MGKEEDTQAFAEILVEDAEDKRAFMPLPANAKLGKEFGLNASQIGEARNLARIKLFERGWYELLGDMIKPDDAKKGSK